MPDGLAPTPAADLTACDREPIHVPGSVQPHGVLAVLDGPARTVTHVSGSATDLLGVDPREVLGRPLAALVGERADGDLAPGLAGDHLDHGPRYLRTVRAGPADRRFTAVAHRHAGHVVLELEPAPAGVAGGFTELYPLLGAFTAKLQDAPGVDGLCRLAAAEVRRATGFDRVLVYRFDPDWNGTVVAEERTDALPGYLGLRFPAADIPAQARELYRVNRVRLIADVGARPSPLLGPPGAPPLDLTYSTLRSVSPVHLEYMRNMGTAASMSVSVLAGGRLWGLIACHHHAPRYVPFETRAACDSLGQVFALQLAGTEAAAAYEQRLSHRAVQTELLAHMAAAKDIAAGLVGDPAALMAFAGAAGAAVVTGREVRTVGETPPAVDLFVLADWLAANGREVYRTDTLAADYPPAAAYADRASGLLAVSISKLRPAYVLWFRPEVVRTVTWAGEPQKAVDAQSNSGFSASGGREPRGHIPVRQGEAPAEPAIRTTVAGSAGASPSRENDPPRDTPAVDPPDRHRLHPRLSFAAWKETVRGRSEPWSDAEEEAAAELRNAVVGIVLRAAEERAELTGELERSNKELEAFSYSVSHDLRAPFRHIVGYAEMLKEQAAGRLDPTHRRWLETITESAEYAGKLVDNLLAFSQMGRATLDPRPVDMNQLVREVCKEQGFLAAGRRIEWDVGDLPAARGDVTMLRMVVTNLVQNAVKYTRGRDPATIRVAGRAEDGRAVYAVADNGVGFDMRYADKLFGVFQRLHRMEDFEGTGIGLANVQRIVARHGGRVWAEGAVDRGATFSFSLPAAPAGGA